MNAKVNLDQQFERFHDHWNPKIVATVNDWIERVRRTPQLAYSFLRHTGLSVS